MILPHFYGERKAGSTVLPEGFSSCRALGHLEFLPLPGLFFPLSDSLIAMQSYHILPFNASNLRLPSSFFGTTSIHIQIDVQTMLRNLPDSATIYVQNKNELEAVGATNNLRGLAANIKFIESIVERKQESVKKKYSDRDQTDTDQFKRWFGDWRENPAGSNKVVNADGTPIMVAMRLGVNLLMRKVNPYRDDDDEVLQLFPSFTVKVVKRMRSDFRL